MSPKISAVKTFLTLKVYPGIKYIEKLEKNEGKPDFQNIKDLTNGSSKIKKVGRSQQMFLKTRCNPYKGFRSSCPEVFCEKDVLKSFPISQENNYCGVSF